MFIFMYEALTFYIHLLSSSRHVHILILSPCPWKVWKVGHTMVCRGDEKDDTKMRWVAERSGRERRGQENESHANLTVYGERVLPFAVCDMLSRPLQSAAIFPSNDSPFSCTLKKKTLCQKKKKTAASHIAVTMKKASFPHQFFLAFSDIHWHLTPCCLITTPWWPFLNAPPTPAICVLSFVSPP